MQAQPFFFNDFLVKNPATTAIIPIKGDSMIDAGIYDGDLAVIERQSSARAGKFVVAQVDGEFTLKELIKTEGGVGDLKWLKEKYFANYKTRFSWPGV